MKRRRKRRVRISKFRAAKKQRIALLGPSCELCNNPHDIGHHVNGKGKNSVFDIMLRCWICERQCHDEHKRGNPWWSNKIHQQNNSEILRLQRVH